MLKARAAAKAVKAAKAQGRYAKKLPWTERGGAATATELQQYLGHFGSEGPKPRTPAAKRSAKKTQTKSAAAKKVYRRAS